MQPTQAADFGLYELSRTPYGPFERYTLLNKATGNRFSVVPAVGATLLEVELKGVSVVEACDSPDELADNKWAKNALLFPFPGRIEDGRYTWEGQAYQFDLDNPDTGNAIHGFARHAAFEVDQVVLAKNHAAIRCSYHYSGQWNAYPFPFQLDVEYSIFDHGVFRLAVHCRNLHFYDIPIGFGWHPYFTLTERADDTVLQLPPCRRQELDARMLPTGEQTAFEFFRQAAALGERQIDHPFRVDEHLNRFEVGLTGKNYRLVLRADREIFPFLVVFTPPARRSVAVEHMTCNANAFNTGDGMIHLPPDAVWGGEIELQLENR